MAEWNMNAANWHTIDESDLPCWALPELTSDQKDRIEQFHDARFGDDYPKKLTTQWLWTLAWGYWRALDPDIAHEIHRFWSQGYTLAEIELVSGACGLTHALSYVEHVLEGVTPLKERALVYERHRMRGDAKRDKDPHYKRFVRAITIWLPRWLRDKDPHYKKFARLDKLKGLHPADIVAWEELLSSDRISPNSRHALTDWISEMQTGIVRLLSLGYTYAEITEACGIARGGAPHVGGGEFGRSAWKAFGVSVEERQQWRELRMKRRIEKEKQRQCDRYANDPNHRERMKERQRTRSTTIRNSPKLPQNFHIQQWERQGRKCYHCSKALDNPEHLDHLIPLSRGGTHTPDNLVASCVRCNVRKGGKTAEEFARVRHHPMYSKLERRIVGTYRKGTE